MFQFTKDQVELMKSLNCTVSFASRGPTYRDNPIPGGPPVIDPTGPKPGVCCMVHDESVPDSPPYVIEWADSKQEALKLALAKAPSAEKPLTPAQRYQAEKSKVALQSKDERIKELEAKLAAAGLDVPPAAPVQDVPEPVQAEATAAVSTTIKQRPTATQTKR